MTIDEDQSWNILGNHFKNDGFVHHQTDSFNYFIDEGIPRIITGDPDMVITPNDEEDKTYSKYTLKFHDVYIPQPTVIEENRELRDVYPSETRIRDLTYDSPIYVNITEKIELCNGTVETNTHHRVVLGRIPIMLRSNRCYLSNMNKEERIKAKECEYDEGGYFIIKGKERVLIAQLRGVYNIPMIIEQKPGTKFDILCEMRSMSEETGHSVVVQIISCENHIYATLPYVKEMIPIGIVFKAMGYTKEDFVSFIGITTKEMDIHYRLITNDSFCVEEQGDGFDYFTTVCEEENPDDLWDAFCESERLMWKQRSTQAKALRYIGNFAKNIQKDSDCQAYAKQVVENEMFPHMGVTSSTKENAFMLGHMVQKVLMIKLGMHGKPTESGIDERDNYINKRVESAGMLCFELFRQLFKKYKSIISSQIEKKKHIPDAMSIIARLTEITKGFLQCFSKGSWGVPKASYVKPGVSQILSRLSYGATVSNLRRVAIPKAKESKNAAIRQIHPSQIMFICPIETPEGQPVGIVLNLSLLTRISNGVPTVLVREILENCDNMILTKDYEGINDQTKVFLNGILMGMSEEPHELVDELKQLRENFSLPWEVSISHDDVDEEIHIWCDEGRLLRPVFTVSNDTLNITPEDGIEWDDLVDKGKIVYIDNSEANNAVIAFHPNELSKYHNDYCEIAPAMMMGVMGNIIPFPDHSQSPRNTYQSAMGKQAMSMFCLSHLQRTDTIVHVLNTPQRPLVGTRGGEFMGFHDMPSGINTVVAIACYSGLN